MPSNVNHMLSNVYTGLLGRGNNSLIVAANNRPENYQGAHFNLAHSFGLSGSAILKALIIRGAISSEYSSV